MRSLAYVGLWSIPQAVAEVLAGDGYAYVVEQ